MCVCVCVLHHGAELPMGGKCMHTMNCPENSIERERERERKLYRHARSDGE